MRLKISILIFCLFGLSGLSAQSAIPKCCNTTDEELEIETKILDQPCIDALIDADGTIIWQNPNAAFQISSVTISAGTGTNDNGGERYTVNFPNLGIGPDYGITATPYSGLDPSALTIADVITTATSSEFGWYEGDDGGGIDDAELTRHSFKIDGCSCEVVTSVETVPVIQCDSEIESEITVTRPDDTPNVNWANENLESGIQLSDDLEGCWTISASSPNSANMVGLDSDDPNENYNTIDYTFYIYENGGTRLLRIYENGVFVFNYPAAWQIGDQLCIRRIGGVVGYLVNGVVIHPSGTNSTGPLQMASSFYYTTTGTWSVGSITLSDLSFCEYVATSNMRFSSLSTFKNDSKLMLLLASSDPLLLQVWDKLQITSKEEKEALKQYESINEKELINFIQENTK